MEKQYDPEKRGAGYAWAALLGSVAVYDLVAPETYSNGFSRAINSENPWIRYGSRLGGAALALHLADALGRFDPIDKAVELLGDYSTKGAHIP